MKHKWSFFAVAERLGQSVITVCTVCGEARSTKVTIDEPRMADLSGDCPGERDAP